MILEVACSRCVRSLLLAMLERVSLSIQKWLTNMEYDGLQVKWYQTNLKVYRMTLTSIISMHPQLCNVKSWRFACSRSVFSSVRRIGYCWLMASTKTCMFSTFSTIAEVTCIYRAAWAWSRLPVCYFLWISLEEMATAGELWSMKSTFFKKIQLLVSHVELEWNLVGIILFKGFAVHLEE
jgi:hypothetical protein